MSTYFHQNVQKISEKSIAVDKHGTIRTELVITVDVAMDANHPKYNGGIVSELINSTVEFLKEHDSYDGAIFQSTQV
jgi:pimeloyl-CoA synthetase